MVVAIVVPIGAVAGSAAGVITARAGHPGRPSPSSTPTVTLTEPSSALSPSPEPAEQRAAQGLSALVAQSVAVRGSVESAFSDLTRCGPRVAKDAATFRQAAASRQHLLSALPPCPAGPPCRPR